MTNTHVERLARLNAFERTFSNLENTAHILARDAIRAVNFPEAIFLCDDLAADNERLRALLEECLETFVAVGNLMDTCYIGNTARALAIQGNTLAKLRAAGIGGK